MTEPLKLGLAGLGTVGGGVLRLLAERGPALAKAIGRPVEIVAVSARDRRKDRCSDISGFRFVADPVELARDPEIDVFVELIGGEEGVGQGRRSRPRSAPASMWSPPTRRCSPIMGPRSPRSPRSMALR